MFEKITIITLLYLTPMGDIKQHSFEIPSKESCSSWFHSNVKVTEQKRENYLVVTPTICMMVNKLLAIYVVVKNLNN